MSDPNPSRRTSDRAELSTRKMEPAVVRGFIVALIGILAAFGIVQVDVLTDAQVGSLAIGLACVLPIVQALWTRLVVTPNAAVVARVTPAGAVVAGDAAVEPTGAVVGALDVDDPDPDAVAALVSVRTELVDPGLAE